MGYRQSPAAFYVYNSVKIITAAPVTDSDSGEVMCGTDAQFPNMNSNAEAYFGGSSIAGEILSSSIYTTVVTVTLTFVEPTPFISEPTMTTTITSYSTYYINLAGSTVTPTPQQSGLVISLTTPFIYQPPWGATGATESTGRCTFGVNSEQYGYFPQTILDYLIQNPAYSAQYPGLKGCVPGGPSLIFERCIHVPTSSTNEPLPSTVAIPAGGGLTSVQTIYVDPNDEQTSTSTPTSHATPAGDASANTTPLPNPNPNQSPSPNNTPNSIGGIIISILGSPPPPGPFSTQVIGESTVLVIPGPTNIPLSQAPPGLQGSITVISGSTFLAVPSATIIPLPPPSVGVVGTTVINGISYILIPSPTSPQLPGVLTTISGTPELIIGPTTVPVSELLGLDIGGRTTVIGGTTEVVISSVETVVLKSTGSSTQSVSVVTTTATSPVPATTTKKNAGGRLEMAGWKATFMGGLGLMVLVLG